jgi:hypothetical protein
MGYIGNQTSNSYTSLDKQTITGNGGASYTLDHAVANEQEIEVFVNNVRQEPSVAYTVSGTALTMTGNVAASDDFYVVFQGKAIQTTVHPSGQTINASNGNLSGNLTTNDSTTTITSSNPDTTFGNVFKAPTNSIRSTAFVANQANAAASVWWTDEDQAAVGAIDGVDGGGLTFWVNDGSNWIQVMKADVDGYMVRPRIPAFNAGLDDDIVYSSGWNTLIYARSVSQNGSHYSSTTGKFTAPVTGWYHFSASATFDNTSDTDGTLSLTVNDSTSSGIFASISAADTAGQFDAGHISGTVKLTKNDTVKVIRYFSVANATTRSADFYSGNFSGHFIG